MGNGARLRSTCRCQAPSCANSAVTRPIQTKQLQAQDSERPLPPKGAIATMSVAPLRGIDVEILALHGRAPVLVPGDEPRRSRVVADLGAVGRPTQPPRPADQLSIAERDAMALTCSNSADGSASTARSAFDHHVARRPARAVEPRRRNRRASR